MNSVYEKIVPKITVSRASQLIPALTVAFLINPILSLIATYFLIIFSGQESKTARSLTKFYCIAIAFFLGAVNAGKIPENDLVWYFRGYLDAGQQPFTEYIFNFGINGQGRELFFPAINYVLYRFIGPNTDIYIIVITAFYYGLINISIFRMCDALRLPPLVAASAAFFFAAAPNLFSLSALLLRQNVAIAIVFFVIVERLFYSRTHYLLMVLAVLTHASSLFFILLCMAPGIGRRITWKTLPLFLALGFLILNYQSVAALAAGIFSGDNVISYALMRASSGTNYELPPLRVSQILFDIGMALAMFLSIYFVRRAYKENHGLVAISNIILITLLFVISNLDYSELSVRFNFYYLIFFPSVVSVVLSLFGMGLLKPTLILAQPILYGVFIYGLHTSMWSYLAKTEVLYWSFFTYFMR